MIKRTCLLAMLCAAGASAQSGLTPPLLGLVTDAQQQIRRAYGVSGNFVLGDALAFSEAANWAFSGHAGMLKTADQLVLLSSGAGVVRKSAAPPGDAQFAFDAHGQAALYFLAESGELWRIGAKSDTRIALDPNQIRGEVRSIALAGARRATLAICRDNALWLMSVDLATGSIISQHNAAIAGCPAMVVLTDRLIYATPGSVVIRTSDGFEHRVKLPEPAKTLRLIGDGWMEMETAGQSLALRLTGESGTLYRFPGTARK